MIRNYFLIAIRNFFRNKNYHEPTDTLPTLNIGKMAKVLDGVYAALWRHQSGGFLIDDQPHDDSATAAV